MWCVGCRLAPPIARIHAQCPCPACVCVRGREREMGREGAFIIGTPLSRLSVSSLRPTPYTLHPTLYTLHPTPYTLHPAPFTLHPTPHTLLPTPYTLHPTSHTLHRGSVPVPQKCSSAFERRGNNSNSCEDVSLSDEARIWP